LAPPCDPLPHAREGRADVRRGEHAANAVRHSARFLTTIGRQTGQPRTVELWFAYDQGVIYLLGHAASHWVRNLGIDPRVTLEIADTSFAGTAQFVDDKRAMTYRLFEKKYGAQQVSYWYRGQGADRRTVAVTPVLTSH
jgi:deazaflavin-dependent oxidoreductase (nitroreductase family)